MLLPLGTPQQGFHPRKPISCKASGFQKNILGPSLQNSNLWGAPLASSPYPPGPAVRPRRPAVEATGIPCQGAACHPATSRTGVGHRAANRASQQMAATALLARLRMGTSPPVPVSQANLASSEAVAHPGLRQLVCGELKSGALAKRRRLGAWVASPC